MNQRIEENVHCDGMKDARGCDFATDRLLTQATEETFDYIGRGS